MIRCYTPEYLGLVTAFKFELNTIEFYTPYDSAFNSVCSGATICIKAGALKMKSAMSLKAGCSEDGTVHHSGALAIELCRDDAN
jgi:hypothetical protein